MKKISNGLIFVSHSVQRLASIIFTCLILLNIYLPNQHLAAQTVSKEATFFKANHKNIRYSGRVDFQTPDRPKFSYPGVQIHIQFTGTRIDVVLKDHGAGDDKTTNYFQVVLDGRIFEDPLELNPNDSTYTIAEDLPDAPHTLTLFKRTESSVGAITFIGFNIYGNAALLTPPSALERRIEFIGNSITCGYGNDVFVEEPNTGFHSKNENNFMAYGAIVSRMLKAEYMPVCISGRGMYRNNTGVTTNTIPLEYDYTLPDAPESSKWNFKQFQPHVIVINLGSNDYYPESTGNTLDDKAFIQTYEQFVKKLRKTHPNAKIICEVGNMMSDNFPAGKKCWTRIQTEVSAMVTRLQEAGDKDVYYLKLEIQTPPYGEDWHPSKATHMKMAKVVSDKIKEIMGW